MPERRQARSPCIDRTFAKRPHAISQPKTDHPARRPSNSSAAVPTNELPFASSPRDQAEIDATPGTIAKIPALSPTPLLPGKPSRNARSPAPS